MTHETIIKPSDKQLAFIKTLITERDTSTIVIQDADTLSRKEASALIDTLLRLPKNIPALGFLPGNETQEALATIPKSKYAIPAEEIDLTLEKTPVNGDLLFVEVREYMKRLYMRRLTGSVGGFTRWHVATDDLLAITKLIATDPYKYTKLFGEHYACCGSCGADLTDPISRELQLGPECRKKFGK
jgi:hypothetical protein